MVYKIGMLGYKFMGKAHTNALTDLSLFFPEAPEAELEVIGGRTEESVAQAKDQFGFNRYTTDWEEMVEDDEVDVFVNLGPNYIHPEPSIRALEEGKHVLCEKPLAVELEDAERMVEVAEDEKGMTACGFNYRYVPAIEMAKNLIEDGFLGEIYQFRGLYLQDWLLDPEAPWSWRNDEELAGSGALGDLGAHSIDLAHYLVGDINSVSGQMKTFVDERPVPGEDETRPVTVDDAYTMQAEFDNGAMGLFEASRFSGGHKNDNKIEIHGSDGSIRFSLERLNELELYDPEEDQQGFKNILVTNPDHPYIDAWWPPGHIIGWEHTFIHEWCSFLSAIDEAEEYHPSFQDGLKAQKVLDAVERSAESKEWVKV